MAVLQDHHVVSVPAGEQPTAVGGAQLKTRHDATELFIGAVVRDVVLVQLPA